MLRVPENGRRRIAEERHDEAGQVLTAVTDRAGRR